MAWTTPARMAAATGLVAAVGVAAAFAVVRLSEPPPAPPAPIRTAPTPEPVAATPPAPPTFDLVRVGRDGAAVVAGTAEPGATVTIYAGGAPLAEVEADSAGEFVAIFDAEPSTDPQALSLGFEAATGEEVASEDVVVLLPTTPEPPVPAAETRAAEQAAVPADEIRPESPVLGAAAEPEPATSAPAAANAAAEAPPPGIAATAVLRDGVAEVTRTDGPPADGLTLASISYGETGLIRLAGAGDAGTRVRAYVDDRFALDAAVDEAGRWSLELDGVIAGVRRLRLDALRPDGTVSHRIETPFQRDFPPPASATGDGPVSVTVQPGGNLWTLARIHYGEGMLYTQIHMANRDLIRDPDLIYPGQIFVLPEGAEVSAN